jgi:hypothetical protein
MSCKLTGTMRRLILLALGPEAALGLVPSTAIADSATHVRLILLALGPEAALGLVPGTAIADSATPVYTLEMKARTSAPLRMETC